MDIETFRAFCLSFPDTHDGMPFQGFFKNSRAILVIYVGKKMFCFFDIGVFRENKKMTEDVFFKDFLHIKP